MLELVLGRVLELVLVLGQVLGQVLPLGCKISYLIPELKALERPRIASSPHPPFTFQHYLRLSFLYSPIMLLSIPYLEG